MKPTPEQIQRLPKWAQEHIKDQQSEIDSLQSTLRVLRGLRPPSRLLVNDVLAKREALYHNDHDIVRFLGLGDDPDYLEVRHNESLSKYWGESPVITVRGLHPLVIRPDVTNVVQIHLRRT